MASHATAHGNLEQEQLDDLRERMRLLQGDRKANLDIMEANKAANREEIKRLRDENKKIRVKLNTLQKGAAFKGENNDISKYQVAVTSLRRENDALKLSGTQLKKNLEEVKDTVKELDMESKRPTQDNGPLTTKIRILENRLDKAMIKYNEAQSIKKTYEQIVKRLKEERIGFDNQLSAVDRTLKSKHSDYEELLLLSGDAHHAREVAQEELTRVKKGYEEERKRREKELREKHQLVQLKKQLQDRANLREKKRNEIIAQAAGDLDKEGETQMKKALIVNSLASNKSSNDKLISKTKLDIFEHAFRRIKEATGVSDVNDVIQKVVNQQGTTENLMTLTKENQLAIEKLNLERRKLKTIVDDIKYSGAATGHRRKQVEEQDEQLATSTSRLERCRLKYERFQKLLVSIKSGVEHLQDKLQCVRDDVGTCSYIEPSEETIILVLLESEKMLIALQQRVKALEYEKSVIENAKGEKAPKVGISSPRSPTANIANKISQDAIDMSLAISEAEVQTTRPFNQRIELPSAFDDDGADAIIADEGIGLSHSGGHGDKDKGDGNDINIDDGDELTRDKIKKGSADIVRGEEQKRKKQKKALVATSD